jgi:UDP-N-acetylmuramyl pentapeptide phosphotransferase/UDP-N-acetylglucosamine-1-phosphate transferase
MGDTGSLTLGFMMAVFAIHFNQVNMIPHIPYQIHAAPAVSIGILLIPIFDTLRVILFRLIHRKSPFDADRTHVHHYLIALGLSHLNATLVLLGVNILFVIIAFLVKDLSVLLALLILLTLGLVKYLIVIYLTHKKRQKASGLPEA